MAFKESFVNLIKFPCLLELPALSNSKPKKSRGVVISEVISTRMTRLDVVVSHFVRTDNATTTATIQLNEMSVT